MPYFQYPPHVPKQAAKNIAAFSMVQTKTFSVSDALAIATASSDKGAVMATASPTLGGAAVSNVSTATTALLKVLESTSQSGKPTPLSPISVKDVQAITGSRTLATTLIVAASSVLSQTQGLSALLKIIDVMAQMDTMVPTDAVKIKDAPITTVLQALSAILRIILSAMPSGAPLVNDSGLIGTMVGVLAGSAPLTTIMVKDAFTRSGTIFPTDADSIHDAVSDMGKIAGTDSQAIHTAHSDLGTMITANTLKVGELLGFSLVFIFTVNDRISLTESTTARGTRHAADLAALLTALNISPITAISGQTTIKDTTGLTGTHAVTTLLPMIDNPITQGQAATTTTTTRIVDTVTEIGAPTASTTLPITTSESAKGTPTLSTTVPIVDTVFPIGTHTLSDTGKAADTGKAVGAGTQADALTTHETMTHLGSVSLTDRLIERDTLVFFTLLFFAAADRLLVGTTISVVGARTLLDRLNVKDAPLTRTMFSTADHAAIADIVRSYGAGHPVDVLAVAERLAQVITLAVRDGTAIKDHAIPSFTVIVTERLKIRESYTFILRLKSRRVLGTLTINPTTGSITMNGVIGQVAVTPVVGTITIG